MFILKISFKSTNKINNIQKTLLQLKKKKKIKNIKIDNVFKIKQKKKIFTVLKSPHVNKKSREHFLYKNYIQKIQITSYNSILQTFRILLFIKTIMNKNNIITTKIIQ